MIWLPLEKLGFLPDELGCVWLSPFDTGLMAITIASLVLYLMVVIKLEPPTESVDRYLEKKLHKKEPEKPKLTIKTSKPEMPAGLTEIPEMPEALPEESPESVGVPKPQTAPPKHPEARPSGCPHFFGYLKTVPKNTRIPDECFGCPKLMECFLRRSA